MLRGLQRWLKPALKTLSLFLDSPSIFLVSRVSSQTPSTDGVTIVYYNIFNVLKDMEGGLGLFLCPNSRRLNADVFQKCKIFCYGAVISFLYR